MNPRATLLPRASSSGGENTKTAIPFVGAVICIALVAGFAAFVPLRQGPHTIIWQNPADPVPCGDTYSAQAVSWLNYSAEARYCQSTWVYFGNDGNISAEQSFFEANRAQLSGIIFDDFSSASSSYDTQGPYVQWYLSLLNQTDVCAVVYPALYPFVPQQPSVTLHHCVIVPIILNEGVNGSWVPAKQDGPAKLTVAQWQQVIKADLATVSGDPVIPLYYDAPTRAFPFPVPPDYLTAMGAISGPVEVWH